MFCIWLCIVVNYTTSFSFLIKVVIILAGLLSRVVNDRMQKLCLHLSK